MLYFIYLGERASKIYPIIPLYTKFTEINLLIKHIWSFKIYIYAEIIKNNIPGQKQLKHHKNIKKKKKNQKAK